MSQHQRSRCVFDSRETTQTQYTQSSGNTSFSDRAPETIQVQWAQPVWDGTKWVYVLEQPPSPSPGLHQSNGSFHQSNGSFQHPTNLPQGSFHQHNGSFQQPTNLPQGSFHQHNGSFQQPTHVPQGSFHQHNESFQQPTHLPPGSFHQQNGSFQQPTNLPPGNFQHPNESVPNVFVQEHLDPDIAAHNASFHAHQAPPATFHNASFQMNDEHLHLNDLREQPEIFIDPHAQFAYPPDRYPRWVTQILNWAYRAPRNPRHASRSPRRGRNTVRVINEDGEELPTLNRPDILPRREPSSTRHRDPNDDLPPTPPEQQRSRRAPNADGIPSPPPHPHNGQPSPRQPRNRSPSPKNARQRREQQKRQQQQRKHERNQRRHFAHAPPQRGHPGHQHPRGHQRDHQRAHPRHPKRWQDNFNIVEDDSHLQFGAGGVNPDEGYTEIGDVNYETIKWQRTLRKRMREKKRLQEETCCIIFPKTRLWLCLLPILALIVFGGIALALYINLNGKAPEPVPAIFMGGGSQFNVNGQLRLRGMPFVDALQDPGSVVYKNQEKQFCDALEEEFYRALDTCMVTSFKPGSVIIFFNLGMQSNESMAEEDIKGQLKKSTYLNNLGLDLNSMSLSVTEIDTQTKVTTTTTTTTTSPSTAPDSHTITSTIAMTTSMDVDNSTVILPQTTQSSIEIANSTYDTTTAPDDDDYSSGESSETSATTAASSAESDEDSSESNEDNSIEEDQTTLSVPSTVFDEKSNETTTVSTMGITSTIDDSSATYTTSTSLNTDDSNLAHMTTDSIGLTADNMTSFTHDMRTTTASASDVTTGVSVNDSRKHLNDNYNTTAINVDTTVVTTTETSVPFIADMNSSQPTLNPTTISSPSPTTNTPSTTTQTTMTTADQTTTIVTTATTQSPSTSTVITNIGTDICRNTGCTFCITNGASTYVECQRIKGKFIVKPMFCPGVTLCTGSTTSCLNNNPCG